MNPVLGHQFVFNECSICEADCRKNLLSVISKENIKVTDDLCWNLIEECLTKAPLKKIYNLLDDLYGNHELCFPEGSEFIVESIRGRSINKNVIYYFVKWEGWPPVFNTWEPESNLTDCDEAIRLFSEQCVSPVGMLPPDPFVSKQFQVNEVIHRVKEAVPHSNVSPLQLLSRFFQLMPSSTDLIRPFKQPVYLNMETQLSNNSAGTEVKAVRIKRSASDVAFAPIASKRVRLTQKDKLTLNQALLSFQQKINQTYPSETPIIVENKVDSECPPVDFQPIPDYRPGQDVYLPTRAPVGCECSLSLEELASMHNEDGGTLEIEPCWQRRKTDCCAVRAGTCVPYNKQKRLIAPTGHPVYECNSRCPCSSTCPFRVVQLGRKVPLSVFRTRDRGWGVKTEISMAKGTFVAEYLGEILTFDEAEKRGLIYDKQTMTYLFDLDFEGDAHYTVDASQMGNISHFFNHSCDPNLTVRCVFVECLDTKLPRIALFASRFIKKHEELTFDYNMTGAIQSSDEVVTSSELPVVADTGSPKGASELSHDLTPDSVSEISCDSKSLASKGPRMKCLCRSKNCRGFLVA